MKTTDFENLLPQNDIIPPCPTDKFVNFFLETMDKDGHSANLQDKKPANDNIRLYKRLGAIAAVFVVVSGVIFAANSSGLIFNKNGDEPVIAHMQEMPAPPDGMVTPDKPLNVKSIVEIAEATDALPLSNKDEKQLIKADMPEPHNMEMAIPNDISDSDAFASQLIGYDDISSIVAINDAPYEYKP